jgi:hypothetical protein
MACCGSSKACDCEPVFHAAELVSENPPELVTLGGLLDKVLSTFGARLTPSPLPLAAALFGAPGWFVPVTLAAVAGVGVAGLYASGKIGPKAGGRKRKKGKR